MRLHFYKDMFLLFLFFSIVFLTISCGKAEDEIKNRKTVKYEVCNQEELPDELHVLIEERMEEPFQFTYENSAAMYIAVGYGRQDREEYVVSVREISRDGKGIIVDTILLNSSKTEEYETGEPGRCPYIVLKCEKTEAMVLFCSAME